jgi:elongation factor G
MLVNGQHGVEVGTEISLVMPKSITNPFFLAVSQLDHEKANWDACLDSLHEAFATKYVPFSSP